MGEINLLAVLLGALAFFVIGAIWYGPLFGKAWRTEMGHSDEAVRQERRRGGNPGWLIMLLAFLLELLVAVMLGHMFARLAPSPRGMMMIASGIGATIMVPAIGIHYLFQQRSGKMFAIDAGYFITGMTAMGGVFVLLA
jgi:hypothetical protein